MAKQSGLGGLFAVNGYDLSGDVGMVNSVHDSQNLLDSTGIDKSAMERIQGLADGEISWTAFFNDAAGASHPIMKVMTGDKIVTYAVDTVIGSGGWSLTGSQATFDAARGADGSLALSAQVLTNDGNGLRGGFMLTAGKRTDTGATTGASIDNTAATASGADLYLHAYSFAGTDVTVKIEDSANDAAWTDLASAAFTQITAGPTVQRIALGAAAAVRRYLRVTTTTTGGFTSLIYSVMACRRYP